MRAIDTVAHHISLDRMVADPGDAQEGIVAAVDPVADAPQLLGTARDAYVHWMHVVCAVLAALTLGAAIANFIQHCSVQPLGADQKAA